ncbi:uncharacterized protein CDAR_533861 [Caerostris darwini]|uniref:Uncharacterized protein n=1 Tax=Caerostris darwini TaxID=1538125 RepID=A0AAV4S4K5_9ARAC|nr:uncharacterized protein CDAR_533861 [Caerostris darwini]
MKIFFVLVLTAVVGIVSCDIVCVHSKLSSCVMTLVSQYQENFICADDNALVECIRNGARDCNVESEPVVQDVLNIYNTTCTEGTAMNTLYKRYKDCMFSTPSYGSSLCVRPMIIDVSRLGFHLNPTRTLQEKALRIACKHAISGENCINNIVNTTCGEEVLRFRQRVSAPAIRLSNEACVAVGQSGEADNNEIQYAFRQNDNISIPIASPHNHHSIVAAGAHVASNISPHAYPQSAASHVNALQIFIVALVVITMLKWYSY